MATLFALPIAAYGFEWIVSYCESWYAHHSGREDKTQGVLGSRVFAALVVALALCELVPYKISFLDLVYRPGLWQIHSTMKYFYSWEKKLTREEDLFVRRALQQIPKGSLIVNVPRDGSCNCYAVEDANVFFRRANITGMADEETCEIVRLRLRDYVEDKEVHDIIKELGIKYVLLLDCEPSENPTTIEIRYKPEDWYGIETIDENTPGFTLVLSEGDMRLYAVDEA